jgi:hypothetical protein
MAAIGGPRTVTDGLVLELDAANQKSYGPAFVEALVVAGGGGGGFEMGGGGGAGGVLYSSLVPVYAGNAYTVTVGAGGSGRTSNADNTTNAGNSTFSTLTAIGGGAGGNNSYTYDGTNTGGRPMGGGSGGGDGEGQTLAPGTPGQGYAGGAAIEGGYYHSGGGGGAGAPGNAGSTVGGGDGGIGLPFNISGNPSYYSGGGAGGTYSPSGPTRAGRGGLGGGGGGNFNAAGSAATANTGGGGGGGSYSPSSAGGAGGSGIVIIRYAGPQKASGGTITSVNGDTVHTFTTSGTFTTGTNWGDSSGNNNTGALTNGPTYSSANGGSIVFDGVNDSVIIPFNAATFTFNSGQTIIIWMKNQSPSSARRNPYNQAYAGGGTITHENDTTFSYYWGSGGADNSPYAGFSSGFSVVVGETAMVCLTRDPTTVSYYKNGAFSNSASNSFGSGVVTGSSNISIGTGYAGSFGGNIYCVQLYTRALTATEVLQNFNALRGRYGV